MILQTARLATKVVLGICVFILLIVSYFYFSIPSRSKIRGCLTTTMFKVNLCPGSGTYVPLNRISSHLQKAVVLTEDSAFWDHKGFDMNELQKSFEKNLAKGSFARGGSTITQQLAKNMFLSADKTIHRKLMEALITLQLEKHLSKKEILERYLNVVEFGKNIYGVKKAAQYYFKKEPAQLTVIESAWLAFLLPSPEKYAVSFYKKSLTPFARKRLNEIVNRLYQYNRIDADQYATAKSQVAYFIKGSAYQDTPMGLDLEAPEEGEESWWSELDAEPSNHSVDSNPGQNQRHRESEADVSEYDRALQGLESPQQEGPDDFDNMGEGQKVEETF